MQTRSQRLAADVAAILRARNPLLWIITREEARVEGHLFEAAAKAGYLARSWDVAQGFANIDGTRPEWADVSMSDPGEAIKAIASRATNGSERGAWIMRDLPIWLDGMAGAAPCRALRNLARTLPSIPRERAQAIIVLSPSGNIPAELAGHATVIEWTLPDREEIAAILDAAIAGLPEDMQAAAAPNGTRESAIDAAVGLSGEEAAACYARSLIQTRTIDPATVSQEKKRVIAKERVLEWFDPLPGGLDAVGGLDNLKAWLVSRAAAYSPKARAYGLPMPKGTFLGGISGCGKSLTCKAIATAWQVPLLKLDLGALKSKFVGESEGNLRKALATIEATGRCVVWLDEVEKALAGSSGPQGDGGVSSDALGAILNWMQERKGGAFIVATANDVASLPPEFLRKGRFDQVWWIDLPTLTERAAIIGAAMRAHGRKADTIDAAQVAAACVDFTGSEVAELVPDALYSAFADAEREPVTADFIAAAGNVTPLAKTAAEKIKTMREWAKGRARYASAQDAPTATSSGRKLDL
jgi:AAA+ superfamily predicted ATPase